MSLVEDSMKSRSQHGEGDIKIPMTSILPRDKVTNNLLSSRISMGDTRPNKWLKTSQHLDKESKLGIILDLLLINHQ